MEYPIKVHLYRFVGTDRHVQSGSGYVWEYALRDHAFNFNLLELNDDTVATDGCIARINLYDNSPDGVAACWENASLFMRALQFEPTGVVMTWDQWLAYRRTA